MALLGCREIPLGRRIAYLCATYFGWRKGSLYAFRWSGIDWDHGTVMVTWQKGVGRMDGKGCDKDQGKPIFFVVHEKSVLEVLRAWKSYLKDPSADMPVICDLGLERNHDEATVLREDLRKAGVHRSVLFSESANVQPVRFHDLRASFCTWARRLGKDPFWICERSGHQPTGKMLDRYTRQAITLADLNYEPFPNVTHAIPELPAAGPT